MIGQNLEFQTSGDGTELALPFSGEVGITNRFEFLVEPVPYTAIRPAAGTTATGWGDLEITLTYLVARETTSQPAVALAREVKVPTARNAQIGTGKTDYAFLLIESRRFGRVDVPANLGYTIVGQPGGTRLTNIYNAALAVELPLAVPEAGGVKSWRRPAWAAGSHPPWSSPPA